MIILTGRELPISSQAMGKRSRNENETYHNIYTRNHVTMHLDWIGQKADKSYQINNKSKRPRKVYTVYCKKKEARGKVSTVLDYALRAQGSVRRWCAFDILLIKKCKARDHCHHFTLSPKIRPRISRIWYHVMYDGKSLLKNACTCHSMISCNRKIRLHQKPLLNVLCMKNTS